MIDDILLNKAAQVERCIKRVSDEYDENFTSDLTQQDAIILNLQRACQSCIDMGAHYIRKYKLGIPQYSSDIFELLFENKIIDEQLKQKLIAMVGFRNIAIHDYSLINLEIIESIIEKHMDDFLLFTQTLLKADS